MTGGRTRNLHRPYEDGSRNVNHRETVFVRKGVPLYEVGSRGVQNEFTVEVPLRTGPLECRLVWGS